MLITIIFIMVLLAAAILFLSFLINLIILLVKKTKNKGNRKKNIEVIKKMSITISVFIAVILILAVYSQISSKTPKIIAENSQAQLNSISSLEKVQLNGRTEWISIRGENIDKPVILFLAGGPGGTQMAAERKNLAGLEKDYIVVNWDQPGSGKSYNAMPLDKITPDTYIQDGIALTEYLRLRFEKEKIYLIGESWGSALAVFLASEKPEYYYAVIGTGQMVNFKETEIIDYNKALEIAEKRNDINKIKKLKANGVPPYYGKNVALKSAEYLNYLSSYMASNSEIQNSGFDTIGDIMSEEYGIIDKINFVRGVTNTFGRVYQQLYEIDLRESHAVLDVPVSFFIGKHDINAPVSLVEDYYRIIRAPGKDLVWFEHSGHSPWINESQKFIEEVKIFFGNNHK